jgi:hypothetical protein
MERLDQVVVQSQETARQFRAAELVAAPDLPHKTHLPADRRSLERAAEQAEEGSLQHRSIVMVVPAGHQETLLVAQEVLRMERLQHSMGQVE